VSDSVADRVRRWWRTSIIDMKPGVIRLRGYAIEDLIGNAGFVETIYLMLRGELPTRARAALLEAALVASVDHGPQAPSIAIARMAITAGNDIHNAMASAINVLGDTHGGAGQQCMELMAAIRKEVDAGVALDIATAAVVTDYRERVSRYVPGFGHRFHVIDPRAVRLAQLVSDAVARDTVEGTYAAIGRNIEALLNKDPKRPVHTNIDGATAIIFSELGFAPQLGRGLFVLSRSVGILAHAWEQSTQKERIKGPVPPEFLYEYEGEPLRSVPLRS